MSAVPQLVMGLGTGRCGTQSLAVILDRQPGGRVTHECHGAAVAWQGDADRVTAFVRRCSATADVRLIGDVAFYYLPYVEDILALAPQARFICLQRDKTATVESYLTWTRRRNHWLRHDGTKWKLDEWDHCYPKYDLADKAAALGRYWDDYYDRAAALESAYPQSFRVFSTESLNTAAGQHAIFDLLGLPASQRQVSLNVRANQAPPPPAVRFLRRCTKFFRGVLVAERIA